MRENDGYKLLYNQLWLLKATNQTAESSLVELAESGVDSQFTVDNSRVVVGNDSASTDSQLTVDNPRFAEIVQIKNDKGPVDKLQQSQSENGLIDNWDVLVDLANNCTKCKLCYGRKNVVIERGNRNAKWMFVGEGPGENEDLEGKPFVGNAGQLLDKMLLAMKLDKDQDVYICNVVKCRPPNNRNPEPDEINSCTNYLLSQIDLVKPKIIVALGRIASQMLLKTNLATGKLRNEVHQVNGIPLIVTYHPAYLLRNPATKKDTWQDLQLAMATFARE